MKFKKYKFSFPVYSELSSDYTCIEYHHIINEESENVSTYINTDKCYVRIIIYVLKMAFHINWKIFKYITFNCILIFIRSSNNNNKSELTILYSYLLNC